MKLHSRNILFFLLILIIITSVNAQLKLPESISKINEYNNQYFSDFSVKVTFIVAFFAGIFGILSPCILPLLPAYFSYTFKEKKNITLMTLIFFLGFSLAFIIMGVIAGMLGHQSLGMVQGKTLIRAASVIVFILGLMAFFGKSLALIHTSYAPKNDVPGVFLFGILFAVSWTGCLGPVLSGILGIGAILGNPVQSALLLFFYGLGNFLPLFILSFFYDKLNLHNTPFLKGKMIDLNIFGKKQKVHSTNVISGTLLMFSALFLFWYGDTKLFNSIDPFSTKLLFYDYQNLAINNQSSVLIGSLIFLALIAGTIYILKLKRR